jgi:hypothetical protein
MNVLEAIARSVLSTAQDVLPIAAVVLVFQLLVLRRPIPQTRRVAIGFAMLVAGLGIFLVGLELALFPLGRAMARQLADPQFVQGQAAAAAPAPPAWHQHYWTYLFALCIGTSAVLAEPGLVAVAERVGQLSGGTIRPWGLRIAIALGSGAGIALGAVRLVAGVSILAVVVPLVVLIAVLSWLAPRSIVPLAYDSGVIATSTITVPLVSALGVGLAAQLPGRDPLADGFGMVALAAICPIVAVMGYALAASWRADWARRRRSST